MGDYQRKKFENVLDKQFQENFKILDIKKIFNIPILTIKQSEYTRLYLLFNLFPIVKIVNYGGFN